MFPPGVKVMSGVTAGLNSKPAGTVRINLTPSPSPKSASAPSAMVIAPSVVHAGEAAFAAVSAEMPPPPVAPVTVTSA